MVVLPVFTALSVLAAPAAAAPGIDVLSVNGSGCRPGTAAVALSLDRTAVTITYSDYTASAGGRKKAVSRNCKINLRITPMPGFAPSVTSVDFRGFAEAAAGSVVQLAASYRFHGTPRVRSAGLRLAGPYSDNWQVTDAAEGGLATGRCRGPHVLDLDSRLTVSGSAPDLIAMDSADVVVNLTWKPCS